MSPSQSVDKKKLLKLILIGGSIFTAIIGIIIGSALFGFHSSLVPAHKQKIYHRFLLKGTYLFDRYSSIQDLPADFRDRWLPRIEEMSTHSKIGVYVGHGMDATPFLPVQLEKLGFRVVRFSQTHPEKMLDCAAIVVPGGHYLPLDWDKTTTTLFLDYVKVGGGFVGICLGVTVAKKIGLISGELEPFPLSGLISCQLTNNPVFKVSSKRSNISFLHMNGRLLTDSCDLKELQPLVVCGNEVLAGTRQFGKGKVVLFSSHPEGGKFEYGNDYVIVEGASLGTLDLLLDAIFYGVQFV